MCLAQINAGASGLSQQEFEIITTGGQNRLNLVAFHAQTVPGVHRLLAIAMPLPARPNEIRLAWSHWRWAKRLQARRSHCRRRERQTNVQIDYNDTKLR